MLDQTRLPGERVDLRCESVDEVVAAIRRLSIRGAPAIGIAAAMGMALAAERGEPDSRSARERLARLAPDRRQPGLGAGRDPTA